MARAERAEENGVEMFVPYLMADGTFRPEVYPEYGERWRDILAAIREVYSGVIGMSFVNADERLTFIDAFDVALITIFPGLYTTTGRIADVQDPSMEEITFLTENIFDQVPSLVEAGTPVYYILVINSSDGQVGSEVIAEKSQFGVDFREQALYFEAFFSAAAVPQRDAPGSKGFSLNDGTGSTSIGEPQIPLKPSTLMPRWRLHLVANPPRKWLGSGSASNSLLTKIR